MIDDYIILRFDGTTKTSFGPIVAASPQDAIHRLALGEAKGRKLFMNHDPLPYVATGRGRYVAIPLHVWQAGVFDYTKTRGTEKVEAS